MPDDVHNMMPVTVPGISSAFVGGGSRQDPTTPLRNDIAPGDVVGVVASGRVNYGRFFGSAGTWAPRAILLVRSRGRDSRHAQVLQGEQVIGNRGSSASLEAGSYALKIEVWLSRGVEMEMQVRTGRPDGLDRLPHGRTGRRGCRYTIPCVKLAAVGGRLGTVVSFVLFVVAYGFYGEEQTRSLAQALADLGRKQLGSVMPLAIVTQWVLLCVLWFLFGGLCRVRAWLLVKPILFPFGFLLVVGYLLLPSVSLVALVRGAGAWPVVVPLLAMVLGSYVLNVLSAPQLAQARRALHEAGSPAPAGWFGRWYFGDPMRTRPRWAPAPGAILALPLGIILVYTLVTCGVIEARGVPSTAGVVSVTLVVAAVLLLCALYQFRGKVLEQTEVPRFIFYFIDLTLALSALVIALGGQAGSQVLLGPVPSALIAAAPPLLVAAWVLFLSLRPWQGTRNWQVCLIASVLVAMAVYPFQLILTGTLASLIERL
jgi:hypothetical protein